MFTKSTLTLYPTDTDKGAIFPDTLHGECDTSGNSQVHEITDTTPLEIDFQLQSPNSLRRISSSPSVLSGSRDSTLSARELMRELVECTERRRQAETIATVEALGSPAPREAQDFTHTDTSSESHIDSHIESHTPSQTDTQIDLQSKAQTSKHTDSVSEEHADGSIHKDNGAAYPHDQTVSHADKQTDVVSDSLNTNSTAHECEKDKDSGSWVITESGELL